MWPWAWRQYMEELFNPYPPGDSSSAPSEPSEQPSGRQTLPCGSLVTANSFPGSCRYCASCLLTVKWSRPLWCRCCHPILLGILATSTVATSSTPPSTSTLMSGGGDGGQGDGSFVRHPDERRPGAGHSSSTCSYLVPGMLQVGTHQVLLVGFLRVQVRFLHVPYGKPLSQSTILPFSTGIFTIFMW